MKKLEDDIEFNNIIKDIKENLTVQEMKNFRQHYTTSCYEHCLNVSYFSYKIAKKLKLNYVEIARAAMLHDLFLYDWRNSKKELNLPKFHAFIHPEIALKNSMSLFSLTEREKDIILNHMWPVTLRIPKYKETFIVTLTDKYSTIYESIECYRNILNNKKLYRYAYIFLSLLIFRNI